MTEGKVPADALEAAKAKLSKLGSATESEKTVEVIIQEPRLTLDQIIDQATEARGIEYREPDNRVPESRLPKRVRSKKKRIWKTAAKNRRKNRRK